MQADISVFGDLSYEFNTFLCVLQQTEIDGERRHLDKEMKDFF